MCNVDQIIDEIDDLRDIFLQCKSLFPVLSDQLVGKNSFQTAPYYQSRGYNVSIHTGKPITKDFIDRYSQIGRWINENAIIRLFGILNYYKHVGQKYQIDKGLPGWEHVRYCCRIKNVITKTRLNYEPDTEKNIRLKEELISYYKLNPDQYKNIPTPIDKVIEQIFNGCKEYLRAKYKRA
jgi:hypothetical protein